MRACLDSMDDVDVQRTRSGKRSRRAVMSCVARARLEQAGHVLDGQAVDAVLHQLLREAQVVLQRVLQHTEWEPCHIDAGLRFLRHPEAA